jgi:hypothetical protein
MWSLRQRSIAAADRRAARQPVARGRSRRRTRRRQQRLAGARDPLGPRTITVSPWRA